MFTIEVTKEEIELLKLALNGMVVQGTISQQARFYAEKVMPLLSKLQGKLREMEQEKITPAA